jgi:hypothetical protein
VCRTTWQHGSVPVGQVEPREPPWAWGHMAARGPISQEGGAKGTSTGVDQVNVCGSTGARL